MGKEHDAKLQVWKREVQKNESACMLLQEVISKLPPLAEDDMELNRTVDMNEESLQHYKFYNKDIFSYCLSVIVPIKEQLNECQTTDDVLKAALDVLKGQEIPYYNLLPDEATCLRLQKRWAVLVSRVITTYLKEFRYLNNHALWHIPHKYSTEMAQKSEICSLDLEFVNANISGEMAQLMISNQDRYVPSFINNTRNKEIISPVAMHGDQLFEERARNVQWTYRVGENKFDKLEGFSTEFADWHAKVTLYKIEFDRFVKSSSAGELGTTRSSVNRTGKTTAAQGIDKKYNEYKEFNDREVEAHICAAFMEMSDMVTMESLPSYDLPDDTVPRDAKSQWLLLICEQLVKTHLFGSGEITDFVQKADDLQRALGGPFHCRQDDCHKIYNQHSQRIKHEIDVHGTKFNECTAADLDEFGYYNCAAGCGYVFSTKTAQNRHLRDKYGDFEQLDNEVQDDNCILPKSDYKFNYHQSKLMFGLLLRDFNDTIREGDGEHLFVLYKLALLLYHSEKHTKYAYFVLLHLLKIVAILPEFDAHRWKWNRFYNKYGGK
ncbi:hypothetical protein AC249_AIPGENE16794, partial [Paramuricea clavata]